MEFVNKSSVLWNYLSQGQKGLIHTGELLINCAPKNNSDITDFSYLVFPFAKAYEGFLKKLFLDLKLLSYDEYYSDETRIGRILNPNFISHHEQGVYGKICLAPTSKEQAKDSLSEHLWLNWKLARNQVFHYFPHNFRKISYEEAVDIIKNLLVCMESAVTECNLPQN